MAYADQQMSGNRVVAIIIVALLHIALGYALITGLAVEAVNKVVERVTTVDVDEPPPPEEEPPPPPEQEPVPQTEPPPMAPRPPIQVAPRPVEINTTDRIIERPVTPIVLPQRTQTPTPRPTPTPTPTPTPSKARNATPQNQANWAGRIQGDYPSSALRRNEEGTVSMRITIGTNGRVEACSVTGSSGSSALDSAACRGMERYARYNPALNDAGAEISSTTTQSIRYVLPE